MIDNNFPEAWLDLLGGRDAAGWITAFVKLPKKAVDDLLWDAFYFGPLNLTERGQLLAGWLDLLGNRDEFAQRLDRALSEWVEENWGQFNQSAALLASAWSCLCSVVEFSSKLPEDSALKNCAQALRARFAGRQHFLGSFSTGQAVDPLGLYLAVIAEFQDDRSLAAFWHGMCELPDGVPFYHARLAMLGLRRLKAADPSENGTLRAEVVLGLLRLARAFDRLVSEDRLPERIAEVTFYRVAAQTAAAYPNSPRWREHWLGEERALSERPKKWLLEAVPPLAEAERKAKGRAKQHQPRPRRTIEPNPSWSERARALANRLKSADLRCVPEVVRLLDEQRRYAEATGETYNLIRSLRNFANSVLRFDPQLSLSWAEEARKWEPDDAYSWSTMMKVLLYQNQTDKALQLAWIAWKRFPENDVIRNSLGAILKVAHRYHEAEAIYRQNIEVFPEDAVAPTGLAEVLRAVRRYEEAITVYRQIVNNFPDDVIAHTALADTLRLSGDLKAAEAEYRQLIKSGIATSVTFMGMAYLMLEMGETRRADALHFTERALELDPRSKVAKDLKRKLAVERRTNLNDLQNDWHAAADALFGAGVLSRGSSEEQSEVAEQGGHPETEPSRPPARTTTRAEDAQHTKPTLHKETPPREHKGAPTAHRHGQPEIEKSQPHDWQTKPPEDEPGELHSGHVDSRRFTSADAMEVAALVAEAYFYRTWAKDSGGLTAQNRREKAARLLDQAEELLPQDPQVLAERLALMAEEGDETAAYQKLTTQLGSHSASISLLNLKARLERRRARREKRPLNHVTLTELCAIPQRLRDFDLTPTPLFYFQKGLAALSLSDGMERKQTASNAFSKFRRILAHRAAAEKGQEAFSSHRAAETPHFYDWLQRRVDRRIFGGLAEPAELEVSVDDILLIEDAWQQHPLVFEEIEDVFADRLTFRII